MRIAIIGSRTFSDYNLLESVLNKYKQDNDVEFSCMVSGGAVGADLLGKQYAEKYAIAKNIIYPDWKKNGKIAGFLRNTDIINNADVVFAFWDHKSNGTRDSITKANAAGKKVIITKF